MVVKFIVSSLLVMIMALGVVVYVAPVAFASHIDWDARRAERAAEREARRIEREEERAQRELARVQEDEPECTCSARLSYAKPILQFSSGVLTVTPRVDLSVNLRGDSDGPKHTVGVKYSGSSSYQSDDVSVPSGSSFSGEKTILSSASCEGRWNLRGVELEKVSLSGITQSLVGDDEQLTGTMQLKAEVSGCGVEEENRQFSFRLRELGNLRIGGWRSVR